MSVTARMQVAATDPASAITISIECAFPPFQSKLRRPLGRRDRIDDPPRIGAPVPVRADQHHGREAQQRPDHQSDCEVAHSGETDAHGFTHRQLVSGPVIALVTFPNTGAGEGVRACQDAPVIVRAQQDNDYEAIRYVYRRLFGGRGFGRRRTLVRSHPRSVCSRRCGRRATSFPSSRLRH